MAFTFEAELVATIQAISLAWAKQLEEAWLETDYVYGVSLSEQIIGGSLEVASMLGVMSRPNLPNGDSR